MKLTDLSLNLSIVPSILSLYFDVMGKQIDVLLCSCSSLAWAGFLLSSALCEVVRAHLSGHLEAYGNPVPITSISLA